MTDTCFQEEITKLKTIYGEKAYPTERIKLIRREMQRFDDHEFRQIVDELIATCGSAPLLDKFRAVAGNVVSKQPELQKSDYWENVQPVCGDCKNRGVVRAVHRVNGNDYAFRCPCVSGDKRNANFTRWSWDLDAEYELQQR